MATKITITLEPIITFNAGTRMYTAKFADIPAMAVDETPELAILRLISIFEVLLKEQKEIIYDRLIKKQIEQAINDDPEYKLVRISEIGKKDEMKLQLVS